MEPLAGGLHHVTAMASGARARDSFLTATLGRRRVKTTVNFARDEKWRILGRRCGSRDSTRICARRSSPGSSRWPDPPGDTEEAP